MSRRGFKALVALGLALGAAYGGAAAVDYPTVAVPPGTMRLSVPLNPFLGTDPLAVRVRIGKGLRMGRYGVSNRLWNACYRAGVCPHPAQMRSDEGLDHPVARVDLNDAMVFAEWLSKMSGRHYRLPTEGEWYYVYAMGHDFTLRVKDSKAGISAVPKRTRARGSFGANAWGVADLDGNVWEWTLSCYTLSASRLLAAPDIAALQRCDACVTRVLGGESCASAPDFVRDDYGGGCASGEPVANIGFRLVREDLPCALSR